MASSEQFFIQQVIQGTSIDVGETGVKAAAYTKVAMLTGAPNPGRVNIETFIVDHPFLYEYDTPDGVRCSSASCGTCRQTTSIATVRLPDVGR